MCSNTGSDPYSVVFICQAKIRKSPEMASPCVGCNNPLFLNSMLSDFMNFNVYILYFYVLFYVFYVFSATITCCCSWSSDCWRLPGVFAREQTTGHRQMYGDDALRDGKSLCLDRPNSKIQKKIEKTLRQVPDIFHEMFPELNTVSSLVLFVLLSHILQRMEFKVAGAFRTS